MAEESDWVDGVWDKADLATPDSLSADGKTYKKITYEKELPISSKRNLLVLRIGGYGVTYSGNVYITDIKFDDMEMDLSTVDTDVLNTSSGDGLSELEISSFQGKDSIAFKGNFSDIDGAWQEATVNIDIKGYDYSKCQKVSCVVYFEDAPETSFSIVLSLSEKYDFAGNMELLESKFDEYGRLVAEGAASEETAENCKALISEMITNAPLYTMESDIADGLTAALTAKSEAMNNIIDYDEGILQLKAENQKVNESLSNAVTNVRDNIEEIASTQNSTMSVLIYSVFIIGAALVVLLSLFVISSVQKSINQFKGTLGQITNGEIMVKARTDNKNEFDAFGSSLNNMTDKLSEVMGDAASCVTALNGTGAELEKVSQNCEEVSEQLELSISGIAQGANTQAADVETSTGEISHLGTLMDGINKDINELDKTSVDMKQASDGAKEILRELSNSNDHMTDSIHRIESQIVKTNDSVKEIEQAIALISSIAEQTNLLSLNASIEAARAGDAC